MPRSRRIRKPLPHQAIGRAASAAKPRSLPAASPRRPLLYGCFFASGAAGLILEVVWSKYLSLLLGNSIYGVSTVVAAFLGGLGVGAALGGRLAPPAGGPLLPYPPLGLGVAGPRLVGPAP